MQQSGVDHMPLAMETLLLGLALVPLLVALFFFRLSVCAPRCDECGIVTHVSAHEIPETSPPVFELVYSCPRCRKTMGRRYVNPLAD